MKTGGLKISLEMLRLIGEIDEFKGSWRTLTTLAPERLAVLKRGLLLRQGQGRGAWYGLPPA
jgi:hypothetical protein